MKKLLPAIFSLLLSFVLFSFVLAPVTTAQEPTTAPTFGTGLVEGDWYKDQEVTFVGKNAARSGLLLDWTLQNYDWSTLDDSGLNPLIPFWETIRNIVFGLFAFFVLVTAFIFIATRGKSLAARRFIPRFIFVAVMIVLSFAIVEGFYQLADIMQGFFLKAPGGSVCPPDCISQKELLFVGWGYDDFEGLRVYGEKFAESGFITLLLTKLTALTYFVMVGILIVRKIILWFFVIISPIFPVLLLYYPLRNTAKIWVGEFFRWLLYGPLFSVFLAGLVSIWQQYIPMDFKFADAEAGKVLFPTGVNILLGGPGRRVFFESHDVSNNLNLVDTFAQYVVALIMLWIVIILPFILLQIFLDYMSKFALSESNLYKQIMNTASFMNRPPPGSPTPPGVPPIGPAGAGLARSLPFGRKYAIPKQFGESQRVPEAVSYQQPVSSQISSQVTTQMMQLTNLSVPTMRDIARFETSLRSQNVENKQQVTALRDRLQQIANPSSTSTREIRDRLVAESKKGNVFATTILSAANNASQQTTNIVNQTQQILQQIANPLSVSSAVERDKMVQLRETLVKESQSGNQLASTILMTAKNVSVMAAQPSQAAQATQEAKKVADAVAKDAQNPVASAVSKAVSQKAKATTPAAFPTANRVQSVSLDDYEAVKKMWTENYKTMDVPESLAGQKTSRKQWVEDDINAINETIALLTSQDQEKVKEGMQKVSDILPFLLIGGFSQTEIVAYLKAKQEAAKGVMDELSQQAEDEDTLLATQTKHTEAQKSMSVSAEAKLPESDIITPETTKSTVTESSVAAPEPVTVKQTVTHPVKNNTQVTVNVYELANLPLPKMHDIASFETSLLSQDQKKKDELAKLKETLRAIASPDLGKTPAEKEKYKKLREALESTSKTGNAQAAALLTAAGVATQKVAPALPTQNRVQTVSLDDYEAVKKLWQENYKTLETPSQVGRKTWIEEDQKKIDETIALLTSGDQAKVQEGMKRVSEILPFLLIGGFTQTEIVAYLKAKQEAAKSVLLELPDETENDKVSVSLKPTQKPKVQEISVAEPIPDSSPVHEVTHTDSSQMSEMRRLTQYALPSMKDIAHFETKGSKENDVYKLQQMLSQLAKTQAGEASTVSQLRNNLQSEERKGNDLAKRILTAVQVASGSEGTSQIGLEKFLINLTNPSTVSSIPDKKALATLMAKIQDASKKKDPLAQAVLASAASLNTAQVTGIQTVLDKVIHPENAATPGEKAQFSTLHTQLTSEQKSGNITAAAVLSVAQLFASKTLSTDDKKALASLIKEQLLIEKEKGNVFATGILKEIQRREAREVESQELEQIITKVVHPEHITNTEERQRFETLKKQMLSEKEQGNSLAATILSLESGASKGAEQEQQNIVKSLMAQMTKQTGKGDALAASLLTELKGRTENKQIVAIDTLLKNIAKPQLLPLGSERAYFTELKDKLTYESERSNTLAMSILAASQITEVDGSVPNEARKVYEQLTKEDSVRNLAVSPILSAIDVVLRTEREKEELTNLLEELAHPDKVSTTPRKEIINVLNTQLMSEKEKKNEFALQLFQKTQEIGNAAPDEKVKIVTKIREMLTQEEEHGNILAITVHAKVREALYAKELEKLTEILLSIADPARVQIDEERERFQEIRESLLKERDSNPFAAAVLTIAEVLKEKQSLSAADKGTITDLLRQKLLNERAKGNAIADAILNAVSISQPKVDVQKLKEQILEAQQKKDPIATMLMNHIEKKALPQTVKKLPVTNRVQSVSFDDYEAVKKMWIENYQKAEVPQDNSAKSISRKAWLESDIEKITQTMALLNSQDPNQVQEGLATVAAILPFLLIGGFSQAEVVAYLKAKQEAAKTVLAELPEGDEGDDLLKKRGTGQKKDQTKTAEATVEEESTLESTPAVFQATTLPKPTVKDIVRYDLSLLTRDRSKQKEVEEVKEMLMSIASPQRIASGEDRTHASALKERLIAEQKNGDKTAQAILAAASFVGAQVNGTANASPQAYEKLLIALSSPGQITDAVLRKEMTELQQQLTKESRNGSQLATTLLNASLTFSQSISSVPDATRIKEVLTNLVTPEHAGDEKNSYQAAKKLLDTEGKKGNVLAKAIVTTMSQLESTTELQKTRDWIMQAYEKKDPVAVAIMPLIQAVSHPEVRNIAMLLQAAHERYEPLADVITEALKRHDIVPEGKKPATIALPEVNSLHPVSKKEFEEVKNLWMTSYQTMSVPANGTVPTRDAWLKKELEDLTTVVTLLSSSDQARIQEGLMKISGILPFFLLGGYTRSEIVQYLTTRAEAANTAVQSKEN